ncbi:Glycosyl hydrolases family 2, sugar binding domain [Pricia antarctica]|uniref:Glycosyl hydrolases family 2, sugar binding domain n=1 Tax=Pricia antarctica TaxID=641691 RepID=A0A1G6XXP1_9FLAO|nr:sugar-binding domain-containing protein [Pricia antarctica]SDD82939.1 Glycosyl hydrolases family 2, sugar binding domain [Pricia antarctica]
MNVYLASIFILLIWTSSAAQTTNQIDLSGSWQVKLDSTDIGTTENWSKTDLNGETITLPGTLNDAGIGKPNTLKPAVNNYVLSNLARKHQYVGKAWYQKEVEIPVGWKKESVKLVLERVIWESTVFVDGQKVSSKESLVGSHDYDLTEALSPGKHLLTIRIDNGNKYPHINIKGDRYPDPVNQDMAHAYTNHTQIKWNGIIGDILLEASDLNAPQHLKVHPDYANDTLNLGFEQPKPSKKGLTLEILDANGEVLLSQEIKKPLVEGSYVNFSIPTPKELQVWDEFHPSIYTVKITTGNGSSATEFGLRKLGNKDGMLTLNDQRIFLRGNLECVIFPLTGHPPMEKGDWAQLIAQAKNYGLNHLRFHSWCPPAAAFEAADEAGFYLQAELPHWSLQVGEDKPTTEFLRQEADKMIRDYGHHPSFIFMTMGNELQGDIQLLNDMVAKLKKKDDSRLYATTSFSFQKPTGTRPEPEDDFLIAQWTDKGWIRGQGVFNDKAPAFDTDYSANSEHIKVPLISHEIGQYSVYPDMNEIPKYTGVLEPLNFIAIKQDLEKKGMLELAPDFTRASGKLAAMLYKEEIERALKTPSFDGFQLLQLQDFPGQGTALVGLLNAFWESKGAISAAEFRKFNSPLVPLLRFEKAVYEDGETFLGTIEVANFFEDKRAQTLEWSITDEKGNTLAEDSIEGVDLSIGNNLDLGKIDFPIAIKKAQQWNVSVKLKGTEFKNGWPIWVYPKAEVPEIKVSDTEAPEPKAPETEAPGTGTSNKEVSGPQASVPKNILITRSFDEALTALEKGEKVLLNPDTLQLKGIKGRFVPVFWSPVHFPDQPGTMGLLIDTKHKALADFPTKTHTEWQWWDLCIRSKSVIIDSLPVKPIIRVIDNFVTNHQLATVFEAKVGQGSLLFSSMDLQTDLDKRPAARQLRKSLLAYMTSEAFNPETELSTKNLLALKTK